MSQEERYNTRDRTYSAWHRRLSTQRFVGIEKAQNLAMIDMDAAIYVEFDDSTSEPLALVETAIDMGQPWKTATVTKNLAQKANIPAFCLLYTISNLKNPSDERFNDIFEFRVRCLFPTPSNVWTKLTPQQWADALILIREKRCAEIDLEIMRKTNGS